MAVGTRYTASISDTAIDLIFQVIIGGIAKDPFSWNKVEIYPSYQDAIDDTNLVETIPGGSMVDTGDGLVQYEISPIGLFWTVSNLRDKIRVVYDSNQVKLGNDAIHFSII